MPRDLRIEIKFKNALLWEACQVLKTTDPRSTGVPEMARKARVSYPFLLDLLNCRSSPKALRGLSRSNPYGAQVVIWREPAKKLADCVGTSPEELFPDHLYPPPSETGRLTKYAITVDATRFLPLSEAQNLLSSSDPEKTLETKELVSMIRDAINLLTPRERRALELRYGLDGEEPRTLAQAGKEMGVCGQRVRELEHKAFLRIRSSPRTAGALTDFLPELKGGLWKWL
jgi:RNA polymerase sigma factor (sigma-70 family)